MVQDVLCFLTQRVKRPKSDSWGGHTRIFTYKKSA